MVKIFTYFFQILGFEPQQLLLELPNVCNNSKHGIECAKQIKKTKNINGAKITMSPILIIIKLHQKHGLLPLAAANFDVTSFSSSFSPPNETNPVSNDKDSYRF